jgi:hypothetical protein
LDALREAVDEAGTVPPTSGHIPANTKVVTLDRGEPTPTAAASSTRETRAKQLAFKRASVPTPPRAQGGEHSEQS